MIRSLAVWLFGFYPVRLVAAGFFLCRAYLYLLFRRRFLAARDFCWVNRVAGVPAAQGIARKYLPRQISEYRSEGVNRLIDAYLEDSASTAMASSYSISGNGPRALFRDLIVLKKPHSSEKGVILLKYARTFSAVVAALDLSRLMERYRFVLEPCWSGYCDPAVLMYISRGNPVVIQCFTEADYQFIAGIGHPLVPVRLGPADWVDAEIFRDPPANSAKDYDLVMVANWAAHKRHAQLFKALQRIRDRDIRVLLVGFAWAERTADDIRREAAKYANDRVQIDILERVPQTELAAHVARCKVFVFLSRKEGDNKALVEAMFANVPSIVYDKTIGGAGSRINPATGVFASDEELSEKIVYMLDHYREFSPRAWALQHTGSVVATRVLNDVLQHVAKEVGEEYSIPIVEKTNAPNLAYKDPACRAQFEEDYEFISSCLRSSPRTETLSESSVTA